MCIRELTVSFIYVSFLLMGQSIRVTLWGGLADMLIEKKATHVGMCPVVVTSTSAKYYNSEWLWSIYLLHVKHLSHSILIVNITFQISYIYPVVHPPRY